ncbi:MAG: hypothetical protein IKT52_12610 [Oscillospiraceae bacterium]|nr:hypothetical protein [Oscillospiraceae bacterium]
MEFAMDGANTGFAVFYIVYMLFCSAFAIAAYVLRAMGFYTIAKRRGINHPWMSWVPVVDLWVLGCISDQFQYVVKGKNKNKRKWLLGLNIALAVVYVVFFVIFGVMMYNAIVTATGGAGEDAVLEAVLGSAVALMACFLPMMVIAIAVMVIRYFAMYDLYTSCSPQNNVLFLVLSIFFTVTEPFFVFFIRKKDGGMPPRRTEPQPQAYIPTWENDQ